jgi:hypothetical protein
MVVTSLQTSISALTNQERAVTTALIDRETGNDVNPAIATIISDTLESLREVNFLVPVIGPTRNPIDVTVVGVADAGADPAAVAASAEQTLRDFLSPANWGQLPSTEEPIWRKVNTVYHQDLSTVLNNTAGFARWTTLNLALNGGTLSATDKTMNGIAPVTVPGTISVVVTAP